MASTISNTTELPVLTLELAINSIRDFFRDKPFLFFGTGMSCALDKNFGMPALQEELLKKIDVLQLPEEQRAQWQNVKEVLNQGMDLESSLNNVTISELLFNIISVTGNFVANFDQQYSLSISKGSAEWPATKFINRLVNTLPESDPILHALTPNYDLLLEYACDSTNIPYNSGFWGGLQRKINWISSTKSFWTTKKVCRRGRLEPVPKMCKHIQLYKVHGSLNYFIHQNSVVENNSWMWSPPDFTQRLIITPGLSKYERLQNFRQELLKQADIAIEQANRFLFLGYGFNDSHLDAYIKRKLITQGCKGLIVTRDSNSRIEALLAEASNLWVVCKIKHQNAGTRIYNKQFVKSLELPVKNLWDIAEFTSQVLGD